jgi:hypothetical protein
MNLKRAIGIIILVCIAVLIVCIIGAKLFAVDLEITDPANIPLAMWYYAIISVGVLIAIGAIWYFKSPKIVPSAKNGFLFGLVAAILGFTGDIVALSPHKNGLSILLKYYTQPKYWMAFILILAVSALIGYVKAQKFSKNSFNQPTSR